MNGPTGAGRRCTPVPEALLKAGVSLVRLFTPEHGPSGQAPDGSFVADGYDPGTRLPLVSLYGPRRQPDVSMVSDLELVVFDLQDVGARFYTFVWTLTHVMEACAEAGVPLWVLDRPNPLSGDPRVVEGPVQGFPEPGEFLGRWPIPIRHSLTLGELARLLRSEMGLDLELEVVPSLGWSRIQHWPQTGLPFHPPSPGIGMYESALLYPGLALLEATNVLEGRGSHLSFRWLGAPWTESDSLARSLNTQALPGIRAHALSLRACPGVMLEVVAPTEVRPVALGLRVLATLRTLWPSEFKWAPYPTVANPSGSGHLFRLLGSSDVVDALEGEPGLISEERLSEWTRAEGWWARATPHLLYD